MNSGASPMPISVTGRICCAWIRKATAIAVSLSSPNATAAAAYAAWKSPTLPGVNRKRKPRFTSRSAAMVPISVRTGAETDAYQNRVSALLADLAMERTTGLR